MRTVILPIRLDQNPFWSSSKGLENVETFLKTCAQVSDIDQFVVITLDDRVCRLAEKKGMMVTSGAIPGSIDKPYTYKETHAIARSFQSHCKNQSDALIIIDHRNLLLSSDDIANALKIYQGNPELGVISLSFCKDYMCQLKSFFEFLDCAVLHFDEPDIIAGNSNHSRIDLFWETTCQPRNLFKITISVSISGPHCNISFYSESPAKEKYMVQILPFAENGPLYQQCFEIFVTAAKSETQHDLNPDKLKGLIFIFAAPSQSGEYDTVEIFTPPNAPWELSGSGSSVINTVTGERLYGRQQFPPVYTYDGSLCLLGAAQLLESMTRDYSLMVLNDACIVTDWVDYWYTVPTQKAAECTMG